MAKKEFNWKLLSVGLSFLIIGYLAGSLHSLIKDSQCDDLQAAVAKPEAQAKKAPAQVEPELENFYAIGDEDAPVTIVEYTNYQCGYCQRHYKETFGKIKENYIDTGKVNYVLKDMPSKKFPHAYPATYAAKCAGEQGKFWEMHDEIFVRSKEWSSTSDATEVFAQFAGELDLNTDEFGACFASGAETFDGLIDESIAEAASFGFSGTPSFSINGQPVIGAQAYETFEQIIESGLQ